MMSSLSLLVLVGVCVFDGGAVAGVECECVVLDVFEGGVCVQGDAGAVFVEVFEVLHGFFPFCGWFVACWLEYFSQPHMNMVSHKKICVQLLGCVCKNRLCISLWHPSLGVVRRKGAEWAIAALNLVLRTRNLHG